MSNHNADELKEPEARSELPKPDCEVLEGRDYGEWLPGSVAFNPPKREKQPIVIDCDGDGEVIATVYHGRWLTDPPNDPSLTRALRIRQQVTGLEDDISLASDARQYLGLEDADGNPIDPAAEETAE